MQGLVVLYVIGFFEEYFAQKLVFLRGSLGEVYKYSC